jgi:hypothetical protein
MEPYLQDNKPFLLTFFLLFAGILPGLYFLKKVRKKYTCGYCGKVSSHIPTSEALADY